MFHFLCNHGFKGVIRFRKSKDRQYNNLQKKVKRTMMYKKLYTKLKIEQHVHQSCYSCFKLGDMSKDRATRASVVLLLFQTQWYVMNEERFGLWLQQVEHIHGHLWQKYSVTVNQVMMATIKLSKWWLDLSH
jgi:ABC-type uncharacterized transport system permease subunit